MLVVGAVSPVAVLVDEDGVVRDFAWAFMGTGSVEDCEDCENCAGGSESGEERAGCGRIVCLFCPWGGKLRLACPPPLHESEERAADERAALDSCVGGLFGTRSV